MANRGYLRIIAALSVVGLLLGCFAALPISAAGTDGALESSTQTGIMDTGTSYNKYLAQNKGAGYCEQTVVVNAVDFSDGDGIMVAENFAGVDGPVLQTGELGYAEWTVDIPVDGLYTIQLDYYPMEGTGGTVQRALYIDGEQPFTEAGLIKFTRLYQDDAPVEHRDGENDIWPEQVEVSRWLEAYVSGSSVYFGGKLEFFLTADTHTIKLESLAEPMAIRTVTLESKEETVPDYATVLARYQSEGAVAVSGVLENGVQIVQAEDAYLKSDQTLPPVSDNSSPANQPYSYEYQRINSIGGTKWQNQGQWITWQVDVPESGLYNIGFRWKQNFKRDIDSVRSIYIDGKLPFAEASQISFTYNNKWMVSCAGGDTPYLFYLEAGIHTITMQVSVGEYADSLMRAKDSLQALNQANWKLLTIIGNTPDLYRDYNIDEYCPEVLDIFREQATQLQSIADEWVAMSGKQDANVAQLEQIIYQLERMYDDPDDIAGLYLNFKDNVSNFANLINDAAMRPLLMDYLFIAEEGAELPRANVNFFEAIKYGFLKFLASFFLDYNNLSNTGSLELDAAPITVWIGNGLLGGRDQAIQLNNLITQDFTADYKIPVNVEIVPASTILTATVSGVGPDVALQVAGGDVANYAMRNAVVDLTQFTEFAEVQQRFNQEAFVPYTYLEGVYGLPETLSYPVMFYRKDILALLDIDISEICTWNDLIAVLPILQRNNMNVSVSSTLYNTILFQMGGTLYKNGDTASALDSKEALDAFHFLMNFYTSYGVPYSYNFVQRFRNGEMPIGIEDYTLYNSLRLAAPEIEGQWGMTTIPGIEDENGNINNVAQSSTAGCIMMSASKHKNSAWKFMQWYTGSEIQYAFGNQLESVMGAGARYNTANIEAFERLPWLYQEKQALLAQMEAIRGVPEVPGGYMTARSISFAMNTTYNENADARKTLLPYIEQINQEIALKRAELGLNTD